MVDYEFVSRIHFDSNHTTFDSYVEGDSVSGLEYRWFYHLKAPFGYFSGPKFNIKTFDYSFLLFDGRILNNYL